MDCCGGKKEQSMEKNKKKNNKFKEKIRDMIECREKMKKFKSDKMRSREAKNDL